MAGWELTAAEWQAIALSLRVAGWCCVVILVPGVFMAWLLARKSFPGKTLLDSAVHLPLVLPPVVTGYLLLLLLGRNGPLGSILHRTFGIHVGFTWQAAVIASAVVGFPLMVRAARLSMELVDPKLEEAARTLGAGPVRAWFLVTLPLSLPGILTGVILAFARSLGEFGATITFAGNIAGETRTLPLSVFTYAQIPGGEGPALRLVIVSVALSFAALVASELFARRLRRLLGKT